MVVSSPVFSNFFVVSFLCSCKFLCSLSPGPRKFAKLTKSPLAMLLLQGYAVATYQGFEVCVLAEVEAPHLLKNFQRFLIHPDKSKFIQAKIMQYPGLSLTQKKF